MAKQMLSSGKEIDHEVAAELVAQIYRGLYVLLEEARKVEDENQKQAYAFIINAIYHRSVDADSISGWPEYAKALGIEFA